jgi:hypothetical protein
VSLALVDTGEILAGERMESGLKTRQISRVGASVRKLYSIWNRGYKVQLVIAEDVSEALKISCESGHIKRLNGYRRFQDITEESLPHDDRLLGALEAGKSGVATNIEDDGWKIDGVLIN